MALPVRERRDDEAVEIVTEPQSEYEDADDAQPFNDSDCECS